MNEQLDLKSQPTLETVLSGKAAPPFSLTAFIAYLAQNNCLEILELTMDIARYFQASGVVSENLDAPWACKQPLDSNLNRTGAEGRQQRVLLWSRIIDHYIRTNSMREVNIPWHVRQQLLSANDNFQISLAQDPQADPPHPACLTNAAAIVQDLMQGSVFLPFCHRCRSPNNSSANIQLSYKTSADSSNGAQYSSSSSYPFADSPFSDLTDVDSDTAESRTTTSDDEGLFTGPNGNPTFQPPYSCDCQEVLAANSSATYGPECVPHAGRTASAPSTSYSSTNTATSISPIPIRQNSDSGVHFQLQPSIKSGSYSHRGNSLAIKLPHEHTPGEASPDWSCPWSASHCDDINEHQFNTMPTKAIPPSLPLENTNKLQSTWSKMSKRLRRVKDDARA
ncbi:hypothetical protein CANCADRAFT_106712 [Tortispora caseinolytica NRRL Y-17796]|uniref:RGS domain-containing protein n=1 Tax=Tortispora caseinolytica NRRL Y-17796 TaxID=767744 RepID=A0A1E4TFK2_9ASCO|nr:hypothetical protein CANCADRAFT_106712 [Tortispora caseinolytica NRRL Y-17796]